VAEEVIVAHQGLRLVEVARRYVTAGLAEVDDAEKFRELFPYHVASERHGERLRDVVGLGGVDLQRRPVASIQTR
jgi:hypothetical protein